MLDSQSTPIQVFCPTQFQNHDVSLRNQTYPHRRPLSNVLSFFSSNSAQVHESVDREPEERPFDFGFNGLRQAR